MIWDTQAKLAAILLIVFVTAYFADKYVARYLRLRQLQSRYRQEIEDILNKDEYKVKGRYE